MPAPIRAIQPLMLLLIGILLMGCSDRGSPANPTAAALSGPRVQGENLPGRLLFVRQGVVWQWQADTARPLFGAGGATQPAWSPTGDRIAYIARDNSASNVIVADAQGAPLTQLTDHTPTAPPNSLDRVYASRWVFYPSWAPDGVQLAVALQRTAPVGTPPADYNLVLNVVPVGPGASRTLFADDQAQAGRSVFSPDGAVLVFVRTALGPTGIQRLYRLPMAGGEATPLAGAPEPSYDPVFSPDGAWLAFAARDGGRTDIFSLPSGGVGVPMRLTTQGAARAPAFSPDGGLLAFLAATPGEPGFDLWIADLSQGPTGALLADSPRRLTTGLGLDPDGGLAWGP